MSKAVTPIERPQRALLGVADVLRVSRTGLIVSHAWCYLLPLTQGGTRISWSFWIGLAYITIPLGLLIYGWNDFFDADVDRLSARKNDALTSAAFGPRLTASKLASLPYYVLAAQVPFAVLWATTGQLPLVGWLSLMALGNALYNGLGVRLSRKPVLAELTATGIYLLIFWLAVLVYAPPQPLWVWLFATLAILHFQVAGTMVDREDDQLVGKRTLSVAFGRRTAFVSLLVFQISRVAMTWWFTAHVGATIVMIAGFVFLASGARLGPSRRSTSVYAAFIVLDWIWLLLLLDP